MKHLLIKKLEVNLHKYLFNGIKNNVGIVRPPVAGTKEQPDYHLDKDTLKAKMAMFQKENTNEYKPRNQIKKNEPKIAAVRFLYLINNY